MPAVWQCQYNGTPRAFYCVNSKTKEKKKIEADSLEMKASQCLSASDYKKSEAWIKAIIDLAKTPKK
jgi:hypothetical protein